MAWKIYACVMLVLIAGTLVGRVVMHARRPAAVSNWDLWEAVFNLVLLPGLFGVAWGRAVLTQVVWEFLVPLAWLAFGYSLFSPTHRELARKKGMRVAALAALASAVLNIPGMAAITLYAYWRPGIWR